MNNKGKGATSYSGGRSRLEGFYLFPSSPFPSHVLGLELNWGTAPCPQVR